MICVDEEVEDKKILEYDYRNSISFHGKLQTVCGLFAGFSFTGITVVLTRTGNPASILSQIVLGSLLLAMTSFISAIWEIQYSSILICTTSPKIIGLHPSRWKSINMFLWVGESLLILSIAAMLLLYNLIFLFAIAMDLAVIGGIFSYLYSWKKIEKLFDTYA